MLISVSQLSLPLASAAVATVSMVDQHDVLLEDVSLVDDPDDELLVDKEADSIVLAEGVPPGAEPEPEPEQVVVFGGFQPEPEPGPEPEQVVLPPESAVVAAQKIGGLVSGAFKSYVGAVERAKEIDGAC